MSLLVLGGTADGRCLADFFHHNNLSVIYSVAGLVRVPKLDCEVVSGGFSQFGGLPVFIQQNAISAILDVTHPYAENISVKAKSAAVQRNIPYWRFHREAWSPQNEDDWHTFYRWDDVVSALQSFERIFLSCGQLKQQQLNVLANSRQQYWLRTAVQPEAVLPSNIHWIQAIGPFMLADENTLFQQHNIDVVVSKNSGGDFTSAKLVVARERKIPVFMLSRPSLPKADSEFTTYQQCQEYVLQRYRGEENAL